MKEILERNIQMVDLKSQYKRIEAEVDRAIKEVIESSAFINGPQVKSFEKNIASYLGVKHAIGCGNGTDALQIALMALDLKEGDEVITTPFTFIATAEVISLLKLKPVFVDVNWDDMLLNPELIEDAITPKTKVIIPVHLFGQSGNMERIMEIAKGHGLKVIEDNAQAIGGFSYLNGEKVMNGAIGDISCTSFFPSKNLGCYGDGGAIFTNSDELAEKLRMITNHGSRVKYQHEIVGVNSRLDSLQASILNMKLKFLDEYCTERIKVANRYNKAFENLPGIEIPHVNEKSNHVFHQYTLKLSYEINRSSLISELKTRNIPSMVYYPTPLHKQEPFGCNILLPVSEKLSDSVISLPIHTEMIISDQEYIIEEFKKSLKLCIK